MSSKQETAPTAPATAPPAEAVSRARWWQPITFGALAAVALNLAVLAVAAAAGASLTYDDAGATGTITAGGVVLQSALPLVIGTTVAAVIARWWRGVLRLAQIVGVALALVTVGGPLLTDTDSGTIVALVIMHIVLAPIVFWVLEVGRQRVAGTPT